MGLRLVSKATTRLNIGEDGDWIDVREDISRREFNALISGLPAQDIQDGNIDFAVASTFAEGLFNVFVDAWSLDVPPSVENYNELTRESATLIDTTISEYFNSLTPDTQELEKSEDSSV